MSGTVAALLSGLTNAAYLLLSGLLLRTLSPLLLGGFVLSLSALYIFLYILMTRKTCGFRSVLTCWPWLVLIGLIGGAINFTELVGLTMTTAGSFGVLVKSDVVFSVILGCIVHESRLSGADMGGIVATLAGVVLVTGESLYGMSKNVVGNILAVLVGLLLAVNGTIIKRCTMYVHQSLIALGNTALSGAMLLVSGMIRGDLSHFRMARLHLFVLCVIGVIYSAQYLTYYVALSSLPVWKVRTLLLLTPIIVMAGGFLFLREPVTPRQLLGALMAMLGVLVIASNNRKTEPALNT